MNERTFGGVVRENPNEFFRI